MCLNSWRDAAKASEAATDVKNNWSRSSWIGVIDEVLLEPAGGNNWAPIEAGNTLKGAIEKNLSELLELSKEELLEQRYSKFRVFGKIYWIK